jgi:acyl-CoA synthetase (NDP forming)
LASDLGPLLAPRSVALVGASGDFAKFNGRLLKYLLKHGYQGQIYPINPRYGELAGLPCYPDVRSLPAVPDCAVIMVATERAMAAVKECIDAGVPSAILYTAGFAERGDDLGRQRQAELAALIASAGGRFRLLGPNCNGLINYATGATLASTASLEVPSLRSGALGIISHSAGVGLASVSVLAAARGVGVKYNVSTGNEVDLKLQDFLAYMLEDPEIRAVACIIEGVREPERLLAAAARARALGKPVLVLKAGRTAAGAMAAASHTAALAGEYAVFASAMRQAGIVLVDDLDELLDAAQVALAPGWPTDLQVGALSLSGGFATFLSDAGEEEGVRFAALAETTHETIGELLGESAHVRNPLDVTASAVRGDIYPRALEALAGDPNVTALLPVITTAEQYETLCRHLVQVREQTGKAVAVLWPAGDTLGPWYAWLRARDVPVFQTPRQAMRAMRRVSEAKALSPQGSPAPLPEGAVAAVRLALREAGGNPLSEGQSKELLAAIGVAAPASRLVNSLDEAVTAARAIGYPVVLKVDSPDIPHKTEAGGVALNVDSDAAVRERYAAILANARAYAPAARIHGVSVQEQIVDGVEVLLGAHQDPAFGPVLSVGLGGVLTEVLGDVAHALPPLDAAQAATLLQRLRGRRLLGAFRGRPARDIAALAEAIARLSSLVAALGPDLAELDINPLFVLPEGRGVRIGDALLVPAKFSQR